MVTEGYGVFLPTQPHWEDFEELTVRSPSEDVKLCFVYQSKDMKRLYQKYGLNLVLLDATHKVCKYILIHFMSPDITLFCSFVNYFPL